MPKIPVLIMITLATLSAGNPSNKIQFSDSRSIHTAWVYFDAKPAVRVVDAIAASGLTRPSIDRRRKVRPDQPVTIRDLPLNSRYVRQVDRHCRRIRTRSKWLNAVSVDADWNQLQAMAELPFVTRITRVVRRTRPPGSSSRIGGHLTPDASRTLDYGYAQEQMDQINAPLAHDNGYYGQGVIVLMLDTGFNLEHEAFDSLDILAVWDFVQNDSVVANQTGDHSSQHNHGTQTFSVLGGYAPGNLIGPAFGAGFLLAKTEDYDDEFQGEEDYYVAGMEWGDSLGAEVASNSLGYLDWYEYSDMDGNTAVTTNIIDYAVSIGITCVVAVGNEANGDWHYMIAPADADSVISVGSVNNDGVITYFSSRGPTHDGRIKPEVCARGYQTAMVNPDGAGYSTGNGTSFSAPLVGGAAAVVLSAHPDWTPMEIREALMMTADRSATPDTIYGYGVIDLWAAINYPLAVEPVESPQPSDLAINGLYPNPFNPRTTLILAVKTSQEVQVELLDLRGRVVATELDGTVLSPGRHSLVISAGGLGSGVYLCRIMGARTTLVRKLLLLK